MFVKDSAPHRSWDLMFPQVEVKVLGQPPSSVLLLQPTHALFLASNLTLRRAQGSQSSCRWPKPQQQHIDGSTGQNSLSLSSVTLSQPVLPNTPWLEMPHVNISPELLEGRGGTSFTLAPSSPAPGQSLQLASVRIDKLAVAGSFPLSVWMAINPSNHSTLYTANAQGCKGPVVILSSRICSPNSQASLSSKYC